jgi:hypothetical protein
MVGLAWCVAAEDKTKPHTMPGTAAVAELRNSATGIAWFVVSGVNFFIWVR